MSHETGASGLDSAVSWAGWCCPYCSAGLEVRPHSLFCPGEERTFATHRGVHRLLPAERRREILPFVELYQRMRRDEGWRAERSLPDVPPDHPQAEIWQARSRRFHQGLQAVAARMAAGPWRVLEVGAGCCWAGARLIEHGHRVAAVDVSMDEDDGLLAAERLLPAGSALPRAEADMEALPLEPGRFDLVLACASLHYVPHLTRTLVELRRVTRRGGALLVLDSPVYRRREDGESMVAARMRDQSRRYGVTVPRESQPGYLVLGELPDLFSSAGWRLDVIGWPQRGREWGRDLFDLARWGRRTARFPIVVGTREG